MNTGPSASPANPVRRRLLGGAALAFAAGPLGAIGSALAAPASVRTAPASAGKPMWGPLRQIDAGVLRVSYAQMGPEDGPPVLLLHGWPYDIHTYAEVAPLLAAKGYRVIVPYLRGYGSTTFLSADTPRN
ncbi:alpha/beta fold hydrolase, partial [Lysobacter sp. 2RAB21]